MIDHGTVAPPREGLPPCVSKTAQFDGRCAALVDFRTCGHERTARFAVNWGYRDGDTESAFHPDHLTPVIVGGGFMRTDDPEEAEAAWQKAERWVLTEELDD